MQTASSKTKVIHLSWSTIKYMASKRLDFKPLDVLSGSLICQGKDGLKIGSSCEGKIVPRNKSATVPFMYLPSLRYPGVRTETSTAREENLSFVISSYFCLENTFSALQLEQTENYFHIFTNQIRSLNCRESYPTQFLTLWISSPRYIVLVEVYSLIFMSQDWL